MKPLINLLWFILWPVLSQTVIMWSDTALLGTDVAAQAAELCSSLATGYTLAPLFSDDNYSLRERLTLYDVVEPFVTCNATNCSSVGTDLVSSDVAGLFDSPLLHAPIRSNAGTVGTGCVWTGTKQDGSPGKLDYTDRATIGDVGAVDKHWLDDGKQNGSVSCHMYCIQIFSPTGSPTSVSPTSASPTGSPTSVSPTSVSPTSVSPTSVSPTVTPTSVSPTSVSPTSVSPTSVSPTSVSPTSVSPTPVSPTPVSPTSLSPTHSPTQSPTTTPTLAPTSAGSVTLQPLDNQTTVTVGTVHVTVPPKASLPPGGSITITVITDSESGELVLSINLLVNGSQVLVKDLDEPFIFDIPTEGYDACTSTVSCRWTQSNRNASSSVASWHTQGCASEAFDTFTRCSCNHLTDFAILLEKKRDEGALRSIHKVFAVVYLLLCVVGLSVVVVLCVRADSAVLTLQLQHGLLAGTSLARVLSMLGYLGIFELTGAAVGFFAALPTLLETGAFSLVTYHWAVIVHYGLDSFIAYPRMRPLLIGVNIVNAIVCVSLFVALALDPTNIAGAVAGACVTASLSLLLAGLFFYYSRNIAQRLAGSSSGLKQVSKLSLSVKLNWGGIVVMTCFAMQALFSVAATAQKAFAPCHGDTQSVVATLTALFLLFDCVAIGTLYLLFSNAVRHHSTSLSSRMRSAGSSRATNLAVTSPRTGRTSPSVCSIRKTELVTV